jgi:hypothetical protein
MEDRNWSTDITRLEKNEEKYQIWFLEQKLNFGLAEGEKLDRALLEKYLPALAIDQETKDFLRLLLYGEKPADRRTKTVPPM